MSLRKLMRPTALTAILACSLTAGQARAADLDPALEDPGQDISAMPVSNVVFGTGWYVRGDFGGAELYKANPYTLSALSTTAPAIPTTSKLRQGSNLGYIADLGGGYSFNRWFRADVIFDFHQQPHSVLFGSLPCQSAKIYKTCSSLIQARLKNYDALVNGYLDLGTWYNVTPYVGAGVGLGFGSAVATANYFAPGGASSSPKPKNIRAFDAVASEQYYNVAFALMAGFAVQVFDHTKLDIGYRYLNQGRVLGTTLDEHEVRAGLRYMIDN